MTVKEIVNLLPLGHPFRLDIDYKFTGLIYKNDCAEYNRVMQEYGDYNVIGIESWSGFYEHSTLWLKAERNNND